MSDPFEASVAAAQRENLGQYRTSYRPKPVNKAGLVLMLVIGLATAVIGVGLYLIVWVFLTPNLNRKRAAKRLHFFEHGLILANATGPATILRWDHVTVLQSITRRYVNGVYVGTTYVYTLTAPDGKKIKVTNFYEKPEEWGPLIQSEITRAQLPGVMTALQSGASLQVGPFTLNNGGIATSSRSIAWSEVEQLEVAAGYLRIKRAGRWIRWSAKPVSAIPNFFVFLTAAEHLRQAHPLPSTQP